MYDFVKELEIAAGREDTKKVTEILCRFGAHEKLYKQTKKTGEEYLDDLADLFP